MRTHLLLLAGLVLTAGCKDRSEDTGANDLDGDGWSVSEDCNDEDASIHPGADETCDGVDQDCDGTIDDDPVDGLTLYTDGDGDGYGSDASAVAACQPVLGQVERGGDCDDANADFHPGARETDCADPNDYNCDGSVGFTDADGDGWPACEDCDDSTSASNPDASEICDDADNDCDGDIDDNATDAPTWYLDADGDGYGNARFPLAQCDPPEGYVDNADDCDDLDAAVFPGTTWYTDADGDGYGDPASGVAACEQPEGTVANAGDCDDTDASANPEAIWFVDRDNDGYGSGSSYTASCEQPQGYADNADDCNDNRAAVNPAAVERCDNVDNDCDTVVDEDDAVDALTWYADGDGDGFGDGTSTTTACSRPSGYVADASDCDDASNAVNPNADEICNDGADNDCDGALAACEQDLSTAELIFRGESANGAAGSEFAGAGDVNGDGHPDLIIGANLEDGNGIDAGAAYLFYGPFSPGVVSMADADSKLVGDLDDQAGRWVGGGHDFNNDGSPDLVIGAHRSAADQGNKAGAVYVVFNAPTGTRALSSMNTARFYGQANFHRLGNAAIIAPDFFGNGVADIVMGAPYAELSTAARDTGVVYVANGPFGVRDYGVETSTLVLYGEAADDLVGDKLAAGDTDGDGLDDVIIGAPLHDANGSSAGAVYIVSGNTRGAISLSAADVKLLGQSGGDTAGQSVEFGGDVNGDGLGDYLVGAPGDDDASSDAGAAYLVLGGTSSGSLSQAGSKLLGTGFGDAAGNTVAGNGDFDGDGNIDIMVGVTNEGTLDYGGVYLFYGPLPASLTMDDADAHFTGEAADDNAGTAARFVPDMLSTGDGNPDIMIGARGNDIGARDAGAAYLIGSLND